MPEPSVSITIRFPAGVYEKLKAAADARGARMLNTTVVDAVEAYLQRGDSQMTLDKPITAMDESEINDYTGFCNADEFTSEEQVRDYFTTRNMEDMFAEGCGLTQDQLNDMAAQVIGNFWHFAPACEICDASGQYTAATKTVDGRRFCDACAAELPAQRHKITQRCSVCDTTCESYHEWDSLDQFHDAALDEPEFEHDESHPDCGGTLTYTLADAD